MNQNLEKPAPAGLDERKYEELRLQVLRRDGWRCQFCGTMTNLEVRHQEFRSHSGQDHENNLVTLCNDCHSALHRQCAAISGPR